MGLILGESGLRRKSTGDNLLEGVELGVVEMESRELGFDAVLVSETTLVEDELGVPSTERKEDPDVLLSAGD